MKFVKIRLDIINKIKKWKEIDMDFWSLEEVRYFFSKKDYIFYKKYILKR